VRHRGAGRIPAEVGSRLLEEERPMALKIATHEMDGVTIVTLDGHIVLGEETSSLRESLKNLMSQGKKKLVLDMKNVTFIDSAGLGMLVGINHSANTQNASLRLCNLGAKFKELLQITKLLTVFDVYNNEADAVKSFSK
jgi:anti-sigma B factor antagonist